MYRYKNYTLEEFLKLGNQAEKIRNTANSNWDNQHFNQSKIESSTLKQTNINYEVDLNNPNKLNPSIKDNRHQPENPLVDKPTVPINTNTPAYPQYPYNQFNPNHYYPQPPYPNYPPNYYQYPPPHNYNYYQPPPQQQTYKQTQSKVLPEEECADIEFKTKTGKVVRFKSKKKKNPILYNNIQKIENEQTNVETLHKLDNKPPNEQTATVPQH